MFTGIIEATGLVNQVIKESGNIHFWIQSDISNSLKVDQSVAHDGVCLTVTDLKDGQHCVTAIHETLQRTNLGTWEVGKSINLERCMRLDQRLDGHLVQGHVDTIAYCQEVQTEHGSWRYSFTIDTKYAAYLVDKGSICVNGVSLTAINPKLDGFEVAIIPYTFEHTNFQFLRSGQQVNLEFDIIGKYILRNLTITKEL